MNGISGTLTVHVIDAVQLPVVSHLGETHLQRLGSECLLYRCSRWDPLHYDMCRLLSCTDSRHYFSEASTPSHREPGLRSA